MAIQGKRKEPRDPDKYVGFSAVKVVAVNPTRSELNRLMNKEDSDKDEEIVYTGEDNDGNRRVRLVFWLYDAALEKFFTYSINLVDKVRYSKALDKVQVINSTCWTSWVPLKKDKDGNYIDQVDEKLLPTWFIHFTNDDDITGDKTWRMALHGENELALLLRSWMGKMDFNSPDSSVMLDCEKLFNGDFRELNSIIGSGYDTPFTIVLGVTTDKEDSSKKYQQVYKEFLPDSYMGFISSGNFPYDKAKEKYDSFVKKIVGEYGFTYAYYELCPAKKYDPTTDPTATNGGKPEITPQSSEY